MAWRGIIAAYREFLPVSEATPVVTLHEGNTPLIPVPRLARRLGISPARLDMKVESRVRSAMAEPHELEQWYGDFSALYRHFQGGGRR